MEYLRSPSNKLVQNICPSEEIKFKTPTNKEQTRRFSQSPDFSPYNYSSPLKDKMSSFGGRNNKRYFNRSDTHFNSSGNFSSPFNKHRRFNGKQGYGRGGHNRQRFSGEAPIASYVNSSMTEDPWSELEQQLERSQESSSASEANPSQSLSSPE